jgi:LysR family glycine cleavage system transcriptional activator
MIDRIPSLSSLRAFEALARLERVNAVAKELHLTHGAVSHQLKLLEDSLGVSLFHRQTRQMKLTEAGRTYAYQVRQALDELSQASTQLKQAQRQNELTVSVLPSFAMHWLMPRLDDFRQSHADLKLHLHASLSFTEFERNRIDCAIRFGQGQWPEVLSEKLMDDSLVLVGSPALMGQPSTLDIKSLWKLPWLHAGESWSSWLTHADLDRDAPLVVMHFTDSTHLLEAARRGMGLALTRRSIAHDLLARQELVLASPIETQHSGSYHLVWPHRSQNNPHLKQFRDWLSIQVKKYQLSLR